MTTFRIKDILSEKGMTSRELCNNIESKTGIKIDPVTLSSYITDKQWPRRDKLFAIAETLDVNVGDLFHPTKEGKKALEIMYKDPESGMTRPIDDLVR